MHTSTKLSERFGAVLFGAALLLAPGAYAGAPKDARSILVLYGFDPFAPVVVSFDKALRETLAAAAPGDVTVHNEVLDLEALGDPALAPQQRAWFQARYGVYRPAVVIAVGTGPLLFALDARRDFWPDVPLLFSGVDEGVVAGLQLPAGVTGVSRRPAVDQTLALALQLLPGTRTVAFIGGAATIDRVFEASARPDLARVTGHLEQVDLTGLPLTEMGQRLAALPEHTIVFGVSLFRDGTGRSIRGTEAIRMLSQWSSAPIFTTHAQLVGLGVVGGWVTDYVEMGRETGQLAAEALAGKPLPPPTVTAVRPVVDARQLERWRIPESRLPPFTEVLFGNASLWRQYAGWIAGVLGVLLLESALIAVLLLERRRRRAAEAEARTNQERIAHLNRVGTVAELSGSLAHELNGPLGTIVNNARAARRFLMPEAPDLKEVRASLVDIENAAERASLVISRLRSVLRRDEFRPSAVDVSSVVQDAVQLVASEALRRRASLEVVLPPHLPPVHGDPVLLLQVLLNLLLNALDAVAEQPLGRRAITVRAAPRDGSVEFVVSDSGSGLPDSALEGVFEPFFTTKTKGLGMGLAICRSIAEAHSGHIVAENGPQGGAVFRLTLPASPARREAAA
ncbi:MAG: ABC transporter substrate binding protein [Myxococcaceae bacterium]